MPTRNVVITEHQQDMIESLVESGRYQNASEVLREGLRLIEQREERDAARLQALKAAAEVGWAEIAAGKYIEVDDSELDDYLAELGRRATARVASA